MVQPALSGWYSLSSGSPAAVGFTYLPQVSPGVIQGLTRGGGSGLKETPKYNDSEFWFNGLRFSF
jgi:hypothetical protein